MKITAVRSFPVKVGFRNQFLVKIDTDEGISGIGEGGMSGRELGMAGMVDHLSRWLIGEDPRRIEHHWQTCYRTGYFEGGNILTAALSAIDIALWDILGQSLGVPVYQLLGGECRQSCPCFATPGCLNGPEVVDRAVAAVQDGWTVLRFTTGMSDPGISQDAGRGVYEPLESIELAAHWLREIRNAVGGGIELSVDFHHRLSVAEAALFCQKIEDVKLYFLEEPIRSESPKAYQQLRTMTGVPFAIGEEFASPFAFVPFVDEGITNFARVDVSNVGGLTAARKVAAMCEAHYIDMMPHNPLGPVTTAASIHFAIATSNFSYLEYQHRLADAYPADLFPTMPVLEGASFPIPTAPGLGVTFDEAAAKDHAFEYWDAPRWQRRDGSYTNW
ncbi:MAG: mandelate racemase/muconate lactonizing enzyme family protein [Thermomicrobiales bacterium]|nr:mandelate racemase/muconate lactonizing enzyme family protein [Thermomicrobiales bacterium]